MYIKVRVVPDAKEESVTVLKEDTFRVSVRAPRERNLANVRVRELIAKHYHVSLRAVRIIHGHQSHAKMLVVDQKEST